MSKQFRLMQKATEDRSRRLGRPRDDNFDIVDMSLTCNDDTSENKEDSTESRMYQLSDLEGVGEPHSETENEREEVDIQEAARVVLDALDISDDENYVSCSEDMTGNDSVNRHEGDERVDPRDFVPVKSNEFGHICELVIDGDTLERRITGHFMLMLQGFKHCEPSYLQTLYNQVEQKFLYRSHLSHS